MKYSLNYKEITQFKVIRKNLGYDIIIEGKNKTSYGVNSKHEDLLFIVEILNAYLANPEALRAQLSPDFLRHLIP